MPFQKNDLVDPRRKTPAERARCLLSKSHITCRVYNWKWFAQNCCPPWRYVVTTAIWSDPTYSALREASKRPIVNLELKIAPDVNFLNMNIGFDTP